MNGNSDHIQGAAVDLPFSSKVLTMTQKLTIAWQWAVAKGKHSYAGTVPPAVVAKRRAASKVARKSRAVNRGR